MKIEKQKNLRLFMMLCTILALLFSFGSATPAEADEQAWETSEAPFIGRWKDKPMGVETMTLELLSDKSGVLTLPERTYQLEWSLENSFSNEKLNLESADLKLFVDGSEVGTARYSNPPESLSLNIDGNEFLFLFKEELPGESAFELRRGVLDGNTYIQESLGIQIPFPDNWILAGEEDLSSYSGLEEVVTDDNLRQYLESGRTVLDVAANSAEGDVSFKVQLHNFGSSGEMLKIVPETYMKLLLKKNEDSFRNNLAAKGITDIQMDTGTVTLLDDDCPAIVITGKYGDADYNEKITAVSHGNYGAMMIAASVGEDRTDWVFSIVTAAD